jgi:hypothetical protein
MDDPKLKRTSVTVKYSADDGYSSDAGFKGTPERPELGLLAALEELARLTALFGFDAEALAICLRNLARAINRRRASAHEH